MLALWLTIPLNLCSSFTLVGCGNSRTAFAFSGSASTPLPEITWPRNVILYMFYHLLLSVISAFWSRQITSLTRVSCTSYVGCKWECHPRGRWHSQVPPALKTLCAGKPPGTSIFRRGGGWSSTSRMVAKTWLVIGTSDTCVVLLKKSFSQDKRVKQVTPKVQLLWSKEYRKLIYVLNISPICLSWSLGCFFGGSLDVCTIDLKYRRLWPSFPLVWVVLIGCSFWWMYRQSFPMIAMTERT